jgi:hypothetical protein
MGKKKKSKPPLRQSSATNKKTMAKIKSSNKPPFPIWYFRSLGILSFSSGGGLLMWEHFWWGVGFIYSAFIFLLLDFCFEPGLKRYPTIKDLLILLTIVISLIFTFRIVLVSAPLEVTALDYGAGTPDENGKIGDVSWKPYYHDIRLYVTNRTDDDYTNLVINVETEFHIAHVGRFGKCLDGSVEQGMKMGPVVTDSPTGEQVHTNVEGPVHIPIPNTGLTMTSFGSYSPNWGIKCDKIKRNDMIEFSLAVVHLDEEKGYKLLPPQKPAWVTVKIDYDSMGHRHRKLEKKLEMVSLRYDNKKLRIFSYKFFKFHFGGIE